MRLFAENMKCLKIELKTRLNHRQQFEKREREGERERRRGSEMVSERRLGDPLLGMLT